jgi:homotetrameric cytidine deaminase
MAGCAVSHDRQAIRQDGVIDHHQTLGHGRDDNLASALDVSMRNVELKARDPEPARTLERALALGADDRGEFVQRDTYFAGANGRLKLREHETGGSPLWDELIEYSHELIGYSRPDTTEARTSSYRRVPIPDVAPLHEALDAAYGTLVTVSKRRHLLMWEGVRIHLDEVEGLGSFLELEAVAEPGSDLTAEHAKVEQLRGELGVAEENLVATSYADLLLEATGRVASPSSAGMRVVREGEASGPEEESAQELLRAADEVMHTAHVKYSHFPVGAALRGVDGQVYVGSNVENAAYPQGQCAETSALGALVAAGQTRITEVGVTAAHMEFCPPCGGCRQRLAEFAAPDTPVHLGRPGGRRLTTTVGDLLPLAFDYEPKA